MTKPAVVLKSANTNIEFPAVLFVANDPLNDVTDTGAEPLLNVFP
jgi:hypothetical protein